MKKVFAFLSTIVLTLACVGVALAPVKAVEIEVAPGKFIVDPTVEENEIPMYIMDSIRSTFPNYYDNNAKPDPKWEGAAREFPWNETKLWISQFDENGAATGKFYAPYFVGAATAASSGAGKQIYNYDTKTGGLYGGPAQESLSFVRFNLSDTAVTVQRDEEKINMASYIIFDGQGKAVRGLTSAAFFTSEEWTPITPEQCYAEDGSVIVADENFTGCDRNQVQATDPETGDPVVDGEGNPVMVDGDPKMVATRVLWQYMPDQPSNLNANGYLGEGWKEENWDYYLPEYKIAILYATSDDKWGNLNDAEAKKNAESLGIYKANEDTVAANGAIEGATAPSKDATAQDYNKQVAAYNTKATAAGKTALVTITKVDGKVRKPYGEYEVPAHGMFYCFGFLDRGKPDLMAKFNEIYVQSMKYGRSETYNGKVRTYNFSAGNLKLQTYGLYTPVEGRDNIFEVLPKPANPFGGVDNKFYPKNNVDIMPLATYWAVTDDITSFKSATSGMEYTIKVDGVTKVFKYPYADKQAMVDDFMKDFNAFLLANYNKTTTVAAIYDVRNELVTDKATYNSFFIKAENRLKWGWMLSYIRTIRAAAVQAKDGVTPLGGVAYFDSVLASGITASTGTFTKELWAFLSNAKNTGWPETSDYTIVENNSGFLPKLSNDEEYNNFFIDPTGAALNTNYVVDITVKNPATAKESTVRLTYVVVDALTPVLTLNPLAFYKTQGQTLNKNTFASAKDAYGNNLSHMIQTEIDWNGVVANEKALPAGDFNVTVSVEQNGKLVQKTAVLHVTDTQKPVVEVQSLVRVPLGGTFYFTDGIKTAVDNVDGNLFNNKYPSFTPFVNNSDTVDTSKPGRYTIEFEVFDRAGNKVSGQYDVIVAADTSKTVLDALDTIQATLDSIEETVNTPAQQGCAAPAAPAAVTFVATVGLLASAAFVVLRRKH